MLLEATYPHVVEHAEVAILVHGQLAGRIHRGVVIHLTLQQHAAVPLGRGDARVQLAKLPLKTFQLHDA